MEENQDLRVRCSPLELFYTVFFQPGAAFRYLAGTRPCSGSILAFFGVYLFVLLLTKEEIEAVFSFLPGGFALFALRGALLAFGGWFLEAAVFNLVAQFLGAAGNGAGLFAALGFSFFPSLWGGLGSFFIYFFGLPARIATGIWLFVIIWIFILTVIAVREAHNFSTSQALLTVFTPFFFLFVLFILALAFLPFLFSSVLPF